jgi:hypothetical protein
MASVETNGKPMYYWNGTTWIPIASVIGDTEVIQDVAADLLNHSNHDNISVQYDDVNGLLILSAQGSVVSVNGQSGSVQLTTTDIPEGTNLYFTDNRALLATASTIASASVSSILAASAAAVTQSNLYTTSLVNTASAASILTASAAGAASAINYTDSAINSLTTTDIEEGSNLYYTDVRSFNTASTALVHTNHSNISASVVNGQIVLSGTTSVDTEAIQDAAAQLLDHSNHVNIEATYNDELNQIILEADLASAGAVGYYGSFYDTTTQSASVANQAFTVGINTTAENNGVVIQNNLSGRPTRVKFLHTGVYNIQFSAQLYKPTSRSADVYVWIAKNGTNILESAGTTGLTGNNSKIVVAWNYLMTMNANDFLEFKWSVSDDGVQMLHNTSASPSPAIPSIIVTAQQVASVLAGSGGSASAGYLNDLLDVSIITPENHQLLGFNYETGLWKNLHPAELGLATTSDVASAIVTASAAAVAYADSLTTTDVAEGTNLYFTDERAQDAAAILLNHNLHSNVTVSYNDNTNKIILTAAGGGGGGSGDATMSWWMGA